MRSAPRGGITAARVIATRAAAGVLALTFPDDCRVCGTRLAGFPAQPVCPSCLTLPNPLSADYFCSQCYAPFHFESALDLNGRCRLCREGHTHFDALYCVGSHDGRLRDLIHLFKFERMESLGKPLGAFLRSGLPSDARFDLLVPMPLHGSRLRERGFNQAEVLAREVGSRRGLPVVMAAERSRATPHQSSLKGSERRRNVKGAFRVPDAALVRGKRVLLVDDVLTTGASANACALALKQAGASQVAVLALARADRRVGAGREAAIV
jgi:ComF family protein